MKPIHQPTPKLRLSRETLIRLSPAQQQQLEGGRLRVPATVIKTILSVVIHVCA